MFNSRPFLFSVLVTSSLWLCVRDTCAQSYNAICTLANGDLLMVGHKNDVPLMSIYGAAWVDQPNPEQAPAKGEFRAVCTAGPGNLFLVVEDESDPKKPKIGLLLRENGLWSELPALPKGLNSVYDPVATGPGALWFRSWHTAERRTAMVHWNGTAYKELPRPDGTDEMHALLLDSDGTLIADGNMDGQAGAYRFVNGAWQPMGKAMKGLHVDRLVRLSDGTLVCSVARGSMSPAVPALYRWDGTAWRPLEGAHVAAKQDIEDLCAGPDRRLYLLIEAGEEAGDPQRLACWKDDRLYWYKGTPETAIQKNHSGTVNLYRLACDYTGLLHARTYSSPLTFPWADFDRAMDGYPQQDASAAALWALFQRLESEYYTKTGSLVAAYRNYGMTTNEVNTKRLSKSSTALQAWVKAANDSLEGTAPKRMNRLADRFSQVLELWHQSADGMAAQIAGKAGEEKERQRMKTRTVLALGNLRQAQELLEAELEAYPVRNTLAPRALPASWAMRDGFPAKDDRAAEVLAAQQARIAEWNAFMAATDRWVGYIGAARKGATGHMILAEIRETYRPWLEQEKTRIDALAMPPDRNRLHDALQEALLEGSYLLGTIERIAEVISGSYTAEIYNDAVEQSHDAHREVNAAVQDINAILPAYKQRNGL